MTWANAVMEKLRTGAKHILLLLCLPHLAQSLLSVSSSQKYPAIYLQSMEVPPSLTGRITRPPAAGNSIWRFSLALHLLFPSLARAVTLLPKAPLQALPFLCLYPARAEPLNPSVSIFYPLACYFPTSLIVPSLPITRRIFSLVDAARICHVLLAYPQ